MKKEIKEMLLEVVSKHRYVRGDNTEYTSWVNVLKELKEMFPSERFTKEMLRSMYRKETNGRFRLQREQAISRRDDKRQNRFSTKERVLGSLKSKRSLEYLIYKLGVTEDEIKSAITSLQIDGFNIVVWKEAGRIMFHNVPVLEVQERSFDHLYEGREFKIALVSDTHLGHKKEALAELHAFYDYAYDQGVTEFYHAGDITDGYYKNRDGSIYEQHRIGFDQQKDWVIESYPRLPNVVTYFITGNHDTTHIRNGGANVGSAIEDKRDDMVYLGHNFAKIWLTENLDMNLVHPGDGSAYGISLKMQKLIDSAKGKRKAKIVASGHYHKMNWIYWKGTHGFTMPSFQFQTQFMKDKGLLSYIGGYILHIKVDNDGNLISLTPEYVELGESVHE